MKNRWDDNEAKRLNNDPLQLRVYTSRLLGLEHDLVLHGGGNTSVKTEATNLFGEKEQLIYIKGSGWDLTSIEATGFAPVRISSIKRLAQLDQLSDTDMVIALRSAMTNPDAPNPSVEAILHAMIPFTYVDHTHADAVVTISNTPDGEHQVRQLYGSRVLVVPYVMPGFILAKQVYEMTRDTDWAQLDGIVLMNHGVFTFSDTAKDSYNKMIQLVTQAEEYLNRHAFIPAAGAVESPKDPLVLAKIRQAVSRIKGQPMIAAVDSTPQAVHFSNQPDVKSIATRGPMTPDHVIRTKRVPVVLGKDPIGDINRYADEYRQYFNRHTNGQLKMLDAAPRWAVWPGFGTIAFGADTKGVRIVSDIVSHTTRAIRQAQKLGGWQALGEKDLFEMEYWELEQAKLLKAKLDLPLQGKVALVTGAASGIGLACARRLCDQGASIIAIDVDQKVMQLFNQAGTIGFVCDLTDRSSVNETVNKAALRFGGFDILVSNAGIFPDSQPIATLSPNIWDRSLAVNLTSHQTVLSECVPYLELGFEPAVVVIGSKNVPAPGPGASAYSVAKAGVTQLARVAAIELGAKGIRVNVIHPNAVFDTGVWTPQVIANRASEYGLSTEAYKTQNILKTEVTF